MKLLWLFVAKALRFEFNRYALVGVSSALVYVVVSNTLDYLWLPIWASVGMGRLAAMTVAYLGHLHFTFHAAPEFGLTLLRFAVSRAVNVLFAILVTYAVVDAFGGPYWAVSVVVTVLTPLIAWPILALWVFRYRNPDIKRDEKTLSEIESL